MEVSGIGAGLSTLMTKKAIQSGEDEAAQALATLPEAGKTQPQPTTAPAAAAEATGRGGSLNIAG